MIKSFYVLATKLTSRISETVIPGYHITYDGYIFEAVSKRPIGKTIYKRFRSMDDKEQLILFS